MAAPPGSQISFAGRSAPPAAAGWSHNLPAPLAAGAAPPPPVVAANATLVAPGRKVARFVTADAAESALKPADDGKLPELQLRDAGEKSPREAGRKSMNPLVLFGLLTMSVVISVALVLAPSGPSEPGKSKARLEARRIIREEYFSDMDSPEQSPSKSYQRCLREAQSAHSRGDYKTEKKLYRKVLDALRADRANFDKGLTGTRDSDHQLEEQLLILLGD
jgi:hypothetical protein